MYIGLFMILAPIAVFAVTLPLSRRLTPIVCKLYRIIGGLVVFLGSGISCYFAAYSGDQGGIAAFYFQMVVIAAYIVLSVILVIINWLLLLRSSKAQDS